MRTRRATHGAPKHVVLIALHSEADVAGAAARLVAAASGAGDDQVSSSELGADAWPRVVKDAASGVRLSVQSVAGRALDGVLAHARTADALLLCVPAAASEASRLADAERRSARSAVGSTASVATLKVPVARQDGAGAIDERGLLLLSMLKAQGLPHCAVVALGLDALPVRKRSDARKRLSKTIEYHFGANAVKTLPLDTASDAKLAVRHITK